MASVLIQPGEFVDGEPQESSEELRRRFGVAPTFIASSPQFAEDEHPVHRVRISRPYYLGRYPVTVSQSTLSFEPPAIAARRRLVGGRSV